MQTYTGTPMSKGSCRSQQNIGSNEYGHTEKPVMTISVNQIEFLLNQKTQKVEKSQIKYHSPLITQKIWFC